ncbi:MAG TPA: iron-containing alcohol dehydrogenase, partial [Victivallales bacterium]|nr:iron-containing alcohol dehydrogenase [Victivallales bacterium]
MGSELLKQASLLIREYTSGSYLFETSCTDQIGKILADFGEGKKISLVMSDIEEEWAKKLHDKVKLSFATNGLSFHGGIIRGANSDALVEDVFRITSLLEEWEPDIIVIIGSGNAISAGKFATLYWKLKSKFPSIQDYEQPNIISDMFKKIEKHIPPIVAFNTSISTSHIDCFADIYFSPEKRIIHLEDPVLRPLKSFFDPRWTMTLPSERVKEAAMDAFSHCIETYMTYSGEYEEYLEYCCLTAISLILEFLDLSADNDNVEARAAIGMASDIGAISLMTARANCGHLISDFCHAIHQKHSIICSVLNPYFMIMYSSSNGEKLAKIAKVFSLFGYN